MGFLLILIGLFNLITPETSWYLKYGWRYKDAEPSEAAIVFGRIGGVVAILIGIVLLGTQGAG